MFGPRILHSHGKGPLSYISIVSTRNPNKTGINHHQDVFFVTKKTARVVVEKPHGCFLGVSDVSVAQNFQLQSAPPKTVSEPRGSQSVPRKHQGPEDEVVSHCHLGRGLGNED